MSLQLLVRPHHKVFTKGNNSPSSSRQSLSTPSPSPTSIDEEELLAMKK